MELPVMVLPVMVLPVLLQCQGMPADTVQAWATVALLVDHIHPPIANITEDKKT